MSALIPKMSVLPARIQDWLRSERLPSFIHTNKKTLTITITSILAGITLPILYRDYLNFLRLGPGGVPHNVIGWLGVSLLLYPFGREMFSTEVYDRHPEKRRLLSDEQVPSRNGVRPVIGRHVVPQRQLDQIPGREIKEKLTTAFTTLYQQNTHLVKLSDSVHENHTEALFLADGVQGNEPVAIELLREIAHIHGTAEYSVHVTLPPQDCKKLIQAGWAQRHQLSGSPVFRRLGPKPTRLPAEYILIYAPRNERELENIMGFVRASVAYMAGVGVEEVRI